MHEQKQDQNSKSIEQRFIQLEEWLSLITSQKFPGTSDLEGLKQKLAELEAFRNRDRSGQ